MKFRLISLLSLMLFPLSSCGLIGIDISQDLDEVTVQGLDINNPIYDSARVFPPVSLNIDLKAELGAQETGPASAAYLKNFNLYITNTAKAGPNDEDYFDFFNAINIYLEGVSGSNLPRVKIAWVKNVPAKASGLSFEVDETVNLLPYIQQGAKVVSDIGGIQPPADDVSYAGSFTVTIKI